MEIPTAYILRVMPADVLLSVCVFAASPRTYFTVYPICIEARMSLSPWHGGTYNVHTCRDALLELALQ